jgi:glycosyltransferase involved in cell wall biosynthesis
LKTPSVSIGLPVRNGEDYLRIAIESLLAQDYRDFELIIADNASDDGTPQICAEYSRSDSRVSFHRSDTNVGAAQNFNRVFRLAKGKYFMWAAHDDRWHPSFVSRCVAGLDQNERVVLCGSAIRFVDRFGAALDDAALRNMIIEYNRLHTHSMTLVERVKELTKTLNWYAIYGLIRADALRQTKLIRDAYGADVILLMELLFHGETMILADPLFDYRLFDHRQIMKTLALQYEGVAVTPSLLAKLKPYTELAKNLLAVIEESSNPPSIKTILREDLLENVSFANHLWANKICTENQSLLQNSNRYLASVQIRDLFARAPARAPEQLRELADRKYQDFLSGLSVLDRVRHRTPLFVAGVQRLLDRHLLWRFRSKP